MILAILLVPHTILLCVSNEQIMRLKLSMAQNYRSHYQGLLKLVNFPSSKCIILFIFDKSIIVLMMAIALHFGG